MIATVSLAAFSTVYLTLMPIVPSLPFPARDDTTAGWKALAARVEQEQGAGAPLPVVGCFYRTASTLAFNLPGRPETWSSNAFGEPGLAYDFWTDPRTLAGREVLVVLDDRDAGWCTTRAERCAPLVPLAPLEVKRAREPGHDLPRSGAAATSGRRTYRRADRAAPRSPRTSTQVAHRSGSRRGGQWPLIPRWQSAKSKRTGSTRIDDAQRRR